MKRLDPRSAGGGAGAPGGSPMTRRRMVRGLVSAGAAAWMGTGCATVQRRHPRVSAFRAEVTPPPGTGMMGGAWLSKCVADSLEAQGVVLMPGDRSLPVVLVSVDWCEIRNEAHARWQRAIAEAVGTDPSRVLVSTIHQHDAPVADLEAERILRERGLEGTICGETFHEQAVRRVAAAAARSLDRSRRLTHVGTGLARVNRLASNRRYTMPDGDVRFDRTSATRNAYAIEAGEGLIDPWLRTLSFWEEGEAVAALSVYAVHPMSYYGAGEVSADFPGMARRRRAAATPGCDQIYCSGCSGNVTAGRYNTGAREQRVVLADRLAAAMESAWASTRRRRCGSWRFESVPLVLEPRGGDGFSRAALEARLVAGEKPFQQCLAAMGLSWLRRCERGIPIQVPFLDLGSAHWLVLPGESYVEYQLAAQRLRPGSVVFVAGYGDGGTGYVPTDAHWREGDTNLRDWCWVAPGAEARVRSALQLGLGRSRS